MAFKIDFTRKLNREIHRILAEQFDAARSNLMTVQNDQRDQGPATTNGVHELRKGIKHIRAVMRLAKRSIPGRGFRSAQKGLKGAAAVLSVERDYDVLTQTLRKAYADLMSNVDVSSQASADAALLVKSSTDTPSRQEAIDRQAVLTALEHAEHALLHAPIEKLDFSDLLRRNIQGYRVARKQLRALGNQPTAADLHELRKRIKDQLYQARLLINIGKDAMKDDLGNFDRLAELLGDHHDMNNLRSAIERSRSDGHVAIERPGLWNWTTLRSLAIEAEALGLAGQLLAESSRSRRKRLRALYAKAMS